jgi:SET domain-containing protein
VFGGVCGNALKESGSLAIAWSSKTGMRGLVATSFIPAGEVIGQYLGRLELFGAPSKSGPANYGYQMRLKTKTTGIKHAGIDALEEGSVLRLMNHSCNLAAKFHEVQTGDRLTVVAVTVRPIVAGEEVTVSYGNKLWFVCRCGWIGCQHRDIQHLPDVHYAQSQKA